MNITALQIRNFKSIRNMNIRNIEQALILVGQNNTGKTTVLDALRLVCGDCQPKPEDFHENCSNIEISVSLELKPEDLEQLQRRGIVSQYKRMDGWMEDFKKKLPSFADGILEFTFVANAEGKIRYQDTMQKHNPHIPMVLPKIYYLDAERNLGQLQKDLLSLQEDRMLAQMRGNVCMFNEAKACNHCFSCIGLIDKKTPQELTAFEALKLLDYKLYQLNLDAFAKKVNENYQKNGGQDEILFSMNRDVERMLSVTTEIHNPRQNYTRPIERMGKGMRSVYLLSLLETYTQQEQQMPGFILVEDPEIFLHPTMQRMAGEILYRLSRKTQVIFSTHSPNLLANFNSKQIRQVVLDQDGYSSLREKTDISAILDDLGYTATDLMNVNFAFIVEGRQDKSRLPLLIKKYYSETYDEAGNLSRIAIITTNSCTNIKTYANLKYMNQVYLKDQFLMIRDGDGKDHEKLCQELCHYYEDRSIEDVDHLPKVTPRNVLVLKYYSFENYFFDPVIMAKLGVVESEQQFYEIFLEKWKEYLYRLSSGQKLAAVMGEELNTVEDVKRHMEDIRIHLRGHNLYDLFYGRFKKNETELLQRYIDLAPRENFSDILDAIDQFIYFESKRCYI